MKTLKDIEFKFEQVDCVDTKDGGMLIQPYIVLSEDIKYIAREWIKEHQKTIDDQLEEYPTDMEIKRMDER